MAALLITHIQGLGHICTACCKIVGESLKIGILALIGLARMVRQAHHERPTEDVFSARPELVEGNERAEKRFCQELV
jgi:hypothetical protein